VLALDAPELFWRIFLASSAADSWSVQQFQDFAGAFDHFLLVKGGVDELHAMSESVAVADYAAQRELGGVVGDEEFENQAGTGFQFAREE